MLITSGGEGLIQQNFVQYPRWKLAFLCWGYLPAMIYSQQWLGFCLVVWQEVGESERHGEKTHRSHFLFWKRLLASLLPGEARSLRNEMDFIGTWLQKVTCSNLISLINSWKHFPRLMNCVHRQSQVVSSHLKLDPYVVIAEAVLRITTLFETNLLLRTRKEFCHLQANYILPSFDAEIHHKEKDEERFASLG